MDFYIQKQWNSKPINHVPIYMKLNAIKVGLEIHIEAPFFNDPQPSGIPGQPIYSIK